MGLIRYKLTLTMWTVLIGSLACGQEFPQFILSLTTLVHVCDNDYIEIAKKKTKKNK